jgi:transposase
MVEIFHRGQRVGAHQRRTFGRKHGTDPDHMPSSHRRYAEWTPDRFRPWARKIGPNTEVLIRAVLASRPHPEQGFLTCLGILRSYRGLDPARLERDASSARQSAKDPGRDHSVMGARSSRNRGRHHSVTGGGFLRNQHVD